MTQIDGRQRRQLTPEQKWEIFLEVTTQQLTQADAARKWGVDTSVIVKLRKDAKDATLAAYSASKPGDIDLDRRPPSRPVAGRERPAVRGSQGVGSRDGAGAGKIALGLNQAVPARVDGEVKMGLLELVDHAVAQGWPHTRACCLLGVSDVRLHRWRARMAAGAQLDDQAPGGNPVHRLLAWEEKAILKLVDDWA